ncbi:MAG: hypothetical protein PVH21_15480 [Myxococcales bacterium]
MFHLEPQNQSKINNLKLCVGSRQREEVLRMVLAITLDLQTAAWCAGCQADGAVNRWPSTVYRLLARAALHSSSVWQRCAIVLDRALCDTLESYVDHSPAELAELFLDGRESLRGDELAALLWCLIRQRSASHDLVAERLGLELEVVAARRLHQPA